MPPSGPGPDGSECVRVLSYNVRSLRDDRAALARVVRACEPDLVCVQESPRFWRPAHQAARLARGTGTAVLSGGRRAAGPLLLGRVRVRVLRTADVLLPRTPGLHQRGFATAVVRIGRAAPLCVTSCHLSLDAAERLEQASALLDHMAGQGVPYGVVGGDFNERPDGPAWRLLAGRLRDGHAVAPWGGTMTSVPADPHQRIDAVFATPGVEVLACGVPHGLPGVDPADLVAATDHLPVLAVLRVPAG
ncbi:endonuclease/exonuclease/phosphatase family protein [Streptacidiphilus sp. ASG 303]|uniref:endonuclease/exonuclease/phosphatase family protein n=1 Tax=Streptacidiphilus sp. ASG 303 TaxID=2896847 RepID=UPI001E5760E5|nr:endonuclease/exonuclease/phosphatase family protein [Streptacidiphilus sp. ASG 303]MCD0481675.1 endonuclease/exonuclease/phosphatase family protein [Streptacidiphilus sp. ASG 303]